MVTPLPAAALAVMLWSTPTLAQCTVGTWAPLAPMSLARQECAAARINGRVYVAGGLIAGFAETDIVEVYTIGTNTWAPVPPMPAALHHLGLVAVGSRLYAVGGFRGGFTPRADVFIFDPAANGGAGAWTAGPPLPQPRGAHWAVEHAGKIYCLGGVVTGPGAGVTRSVIVLDPASPTPAWATLAPMPTAREHLSAVALGDYLYAIGGRAGGSFTAFERYHPATNTWATLPPMLTARAAPGVAAVGPRLFVAGGETPELFSINEYFDTRTNTWSCAAPMPLPRHGIGAVTLPGSDVGVDPPPERILFPAGGAVQGLEPTTFTDQFIPPPVCVGDYNASGAATVQDIFDFLAAYFDNRPGADINLTGGVSVQDVFDFLGAYFTGCS